MVHFVYITSKTKRRRGRRGEERRREQNRTDTDTDSGDSGDSGDSSSSWFFLWMILLLFISSSAFLHFYQNCNTFLLSGTAFPVLLKAFLLLHPPSFLHVLFLLLFVVHFSWSPSTCAALCYYARTPTRSNKVKKLIITSTKHPTS